MFDSLVDMITAGPVAYLLVIGLVAGDAIVPVLPSETAIITGGILAERGDLALPFVILAAALGALVGDTVLYFAGRGAERPIQRRLMRHEKTQRRVERLRDGLHARPWLLIVADFIPGGRTAAMFAAGATELPRKTFYSFVVPGALLWSTIHSMLGFGGGTVFRDSFLLPLLAAFAVAGIVALVFELLDRRTNLF